MFMRYDSDFLSSLFFPFPCCCCIFFNSIHCRLYDNNIGRNEASWERQKEKDGKEEDEEGGRVGKAGGGGTYPNSFLSSRHLSPPH